MSKKNFKLGFKKNFIESHLNFKAFFISCSELNS